MPASLLSPWASRFSTVLASILFLFFSLLHYQFSSVRLQVSMSASPCETSIFPAIHVLVLVLPWQDSHDNDSTLLNLFFLVHHANILVYQRCLSTL